MTPRHILSTPTAIFLNAAMVFWLCLDQSKYSASPRFSIHPNEVWWSFEVIREILPPNSHKNKIWNRFSHGNLPSFPWICLSSWSMDLMLLCSNSYKNCVHSPSAAWRLFTYIWWTPRLSSTYHKLFIHWTLEQYSQSWWRNHYGKMSKMWNWCKFA